MKKLILGLFVAGALSFGLQSCGEDPCDDCPDGTTCVNDECVAEEEEEYDCVECGNYNAEATGTISGLVDTTFTDDNKLSVPASFDQDGSDYSLTVNLSALSNLLSAPIEVEGTFNTTTKLFTVEDFIYEYVGVEIEVNGEVDFTDTDNIDGNLTLLNAGVIDGSLDLSGSMQ